MLWLYDGAYEIVDSRGGLSGAAVEEGMWGRRGWAVTGQLFFVGGRTRPSPKIERHSRYSLFTAPFLPNQNEVAQDASS